MRCDAMRHENAIQKPVGSPIEKQYQEGVNPSQLHAFFVSFLLHHPSCLSCLPINMLPSPHRKPPSSPPPPPIDGGRWGQAAWALGSVRMGSWHGLPLDPRRPVQRHAVGGHITPVLLATSNCTPKPAVLLCWTTTTRGDTLKSSEAQFRVSLVANQRIRSLSRCCSTVPSARGVSASDAPSLVRLRLFACSKALLHRYARRRRWVVCLIPHRNPRLAGLWMPPRRRGKRDREQRGKREMQPPVSCATSTLGFVASCSHGGALCIPGTGPACPACLDGPAGRLLLPCRVRAGAWLRWC